MSVTLSQEQYMSALPACDPALMFYYRLQAYTNHYQFLYFSFNKLKKKKKQQQKERKKKNDFLMIANLLVK